MNIKAILPLFIFMSVLTGCGGYKTGITTEAQQSYIYFNHEALGAEYSIDNSAWYTIEKTGVNELYPTKPGKHQIRVRKNGNITVNKMILLADSISKEIKVP